MARASIATLLSLDRWAQLIGINPAHFNGAYSDTIMPQTEACQETWFQHAWQANDRVSREDVAQAIMEAEQDIARVVGYWPAPKWIVEEVHEYPRHYRPEVIRYGMRDARGFNIGVRTKYGKVIAGGQPQRTCYLVAPTVTYSDADGDGIVDTGTITQATTLTDTRIFHVYTTGHGGHDEWEIRPPRSITATGALLTITFWPWQLIDPDRWEQLVTAGGLPTALDFLAMTGAVYDNLVTSVDLCQIYNANDAAASTLYWEPTCDSTSCACGGTGCSACLLTTQDGCLHVRDADQGIVVPQPATWVEADLAWTGAAPTLCRDPDFVKLWYYAGDIDDAYKDGRAWDPLSNWWAQTIAYLAAARLQKPVCDCQYVSRKVNELQRDLSFSNADGAYGLDPGLLRNPFGTRYGEVYAWRRISSLAEKRAKVAVI